MCVYTSGYVNQIKDALLKDHEEKCRETANATVLLGQRRYYA